MVGGPEPLMLCPVSSLLPCASCFVMGFAMGWAASAVVAGECWASWHLARTHGHLVTALGLIYTNDRVWSVISLRSSVRRRYGRGIRGGRWDR